MNDIEAFDEWLRDESNKYEDALANEFERHLCFVSWQAALSHERQRSAKLVESLYEIKKYNGDATKCENIIREALKWYADLGLSDGYAKNLLKEIGEK
jgi:hypothetical protein